MKSKEYKELKKENILLKRELANANRQLRSLTLREDAKDLSEHMKGDAMRFTYSKSYIGYAFGSLRASSIYTRIKSVVRIFSRFRIISTLMRMFTYIAAFLETGTHVLLASTLLLVSLPATLILGAATFLISAFGCRNANKELINLPKEKDVYIFFPQSPNQMKRNGFLIGWISELAENKTNVVFIVSPCFWKKIGFSKRKYYLHYRADEENVIVIRKYYYFSMKKHVIQNSGANSVTMIH